MGNEELKGCHPGGDPVGLKGPDGYDTLSSYQAGKEDMITIIRAEIERREKSLRAGFCSDAFTRKQKNEMLVASEELDRFNRFLSDLEKSEKPMNPVCESKFKVGDVIQFKDGTNQYKICGVFSDHYINSIGNRMDMSYTDANFELVEHPVCEGLEEELDKWRHDHFHGKRDGHFSGEYLERTSQLELARHFAKWGAEHLKK